MPRKIDYFFSPPPSSTSKAPAKAAKPPVEDGVGSEGQGGGRLQGTREVLGARLPDRRRQVQVPGRTGCLPGQQRKLLLDEKANYIRSAETLKAQADSLALEHEPGDVQFDEEGGEGGTSNVDRELDLVLSAQARAAAAEIDRALDKIRNRDLRAVRAVRPAHPRRPPPGAAASGAVRGLQERRVVVTALEAPAVRAALASASC